MLADTEKQPDRAGLPTACARPLATSRRGTLPAVLAVGAYTVHPAPILRGKRVLERMTCEAFGAPPPGAEGATPPDTEAAESTNRARTEAATAAAECAGCHDALNPPGFAYEHYDAMGGWRDEDNGLTVDASGSFSLSGGAAFTFTDGVDLAHQLAASERVQTCYALRWARYATGLHLDEDHPFAAWLGARFVVDDDIPSMLEDITTSVTFRSLIPGETP